MVTKRIKILKMLASLIYYAEKEGIDFIITHFFRTPEEQNKIYQAGKSRCDGYKKKSKHQLWQAFDIAIVVKNNIDYKIDWSPAKYKVLGEYWKSLGGIWGGDWKNPVDLCHFEI